jgi:hypothetical protein
MENQRFSRYPVGIASSMAADMLQSVGPTKIDKESILWYYSFMTTSSLPETSAVAYTRDFDDLTNPFHPTVGESILLSLVTQDVESEDTVVPEFLTHEMEAIGGLVPVYSAVRAQYLGGIATEGLLRHKNSVGTIAPIAHEGTFFVERPQTLSEFDRTRSIFARPHPPEPEYATYDSPSGHFTFLELLVDARRALVTDQQIWDDAQCEYSRSEDFLRREELAELIRPFACRYWSEALSLADYLAKPSPSFVNPEVIIPHDIPVECVRVYSPAIE